MGHKKPVVGDADVADLALGLGLQHGLVEPCAVAGPGAEVRVVELIEVHVLRPQEAQGGLQVLPERLDGEPGGLGGDEELVPHPGKGRAQLLLAVGVGPGGVKEPDAALAGPAEEPDRLLPAGPLDGERAEAVFRHCDAGGVQCNSCHFLRSFPVLLILNVLYRKGGGAVKGGGVSRLFWGQLEILC